MTPSTTMPVNPTRTFDARRWALVGLNVLGGIAVLGSYVHGMASHPSPGDVWGGVPEGLKPLYTVAMFCAAAGYFPFTCWMLFRFDPDGSGPSWLDFRAVLVLYTLVLIPSALWMPLTFQMLASPSAGLWFAIRLVLALVGIGSVGLLYALFRLRPTHPDRLHSAAMVGCAAFCFQTAVLDAIVWPAFF